MEDEHSRTLGLAHTQILIELLKKLIDSRALSKSDVRALLESAGNALLSKRTAVAEIATEHVRLIGEGVGVSPEQIDGPSNR